MMPGAPNPLMWGQGDPLDELGKIDRSLRLRSAASAYLTRTFGTSTNRSKWTFSCWVKRGKLGTSQMILYALSGVDSNFRTFCTFNADDTIQCLYYANGSYNFLVGTAAVYRDTSAWYHIHMEFDWSRSTVADRFILSVNGVRQAFAGSPTYPSADVTIGSSGWPHTIGRDGLAGNAYFDGLMANVAFLDGQALVPSTFGQVHPRTGQWRPKSKAATKAIVDASGASSFFLPFVDPTNTTTVVADASSYGNNWVANNVSLSAGTTYDSLVDTPTSNSCALNPLRSGIAPINGNLALIGASAHKSSIGTMAIPVNSLIYFEGRPSVTNQRISLGVATNDQDYNAIAPQASYRGISGDATFVAVYNGASLLFNLSAVVSTDVYQIAINTTTGNGWFGRNNTWYDAAGGTTGNPATGANPTWTGLTATFYPLLGCYDPTNPVSINFGQQPFAYTPPSNFIALNTKNLKRPLISKPTSAFVAVTDTGTNIAATLATARAGWPSYIDVIKRRDSSEGWRWIFSDDPTNCLESNNTDAKIAVPSFTGTSYSGQSLKVSAANGIATGRLTHANGVADVVTDGLANSRKVVMLRNEAGSNWFVYHPDLTAGKLLYLNLTNAETTDATISSVTSSGFTAAAALASGTYRWVSFAEVDGFLKLWKYTGNGSVDGPFHNDGLSAAATWFKDADTGTNNWHAHDIARDTYNQSNANLIINLSNAESSQHGMDLISAGVKLRSSDSGSNLSTAKHAGVSFAAFPFRYANAR